MTAVIVEEETAAGEIQEAAEATEVALAVVLPVDLAEEDLVEVLPAASADRQEVSEATEVALAVVLPVDLAEEDLAVVLPAASADRQEVSEVDLRAEVVR